MHRLMRSRGARAVTVPAAVGLLAAAAVAAAPAGASADTSITVVYPVNGNTYLKAPNATASLGPGTLRATLDLNNGALTASLSLPPANVSFHALGLIPVSATTEFIQDGPTKGKVNLNTGAVKSTSKIILKITSMSVAGIPQPVGKSCESTTPAVITLTSRPGFSVASGGKLTGTYTVPAFANCGPLGLLTPLINLTTTGPGNTITLILGNAKGV
jgi:hypothetical protein